MIIDLIYNLSVLVALSVLSGFIDSRYNRKSIQGKILQGLLFGVVAIIGMLYPFRLTEGIIFDGRSIVISLCTLFFGVIPGLISTIISVAFRNYLGGGGALTGIFVLTASFIIGIIFHQLRKVEKLNLTKIILYLFGILTTSVMMILMVTLPSNFVAETFRKITITVMICYPLITLIIGKILLDQEENRNSIERIKKEESLFRTTLYSIADAVITTDKLGTIQHLNQVAERLTGWSENEAYGKTLDDIFKIFNEITKEKIENPVRKVIKEGTVVGFSNHIILISKDGREIPIADSAAPIKDENSKILGAVLVFRDQTEERKKIKRIEESEHRYALTLDVLNEGIWDWNIKEGRGFASPNYHKLLGYDDNAFSTTEEWLKYVHPDDYEKTIYLFREAFENATGINVELRMRKKTGEWIWIQTRGKVVEKDEFGKSKRMLGTVSDITHRKKFEEELINSKIKAEESDRLKSAFLANMSHEIRTPMNGILGFLDLLKEPQLSSDKRERYINLVKKSSERLLNTINDIIEISKIESGELSINESEINVNEHLDYFLDFFKPEATKKGLKLFCTDIKNNNEIIIKTDKDKFDSIFINLIKNALKYTDNGSVEIGYTINKYEIEFFVKDTGIGIPEEMHGAIFQRFYRTDLWLSSKYEGSGLGLSIVKAYLDILNGRIGLDSETGKGSTFYFSLPANLLKIK